MAQTETPSIDLEVANGTYRFALPVQAQLLVERNCRATFGAVAARVMRGRFPLTETSSRGLVSEAEFGALDLDTIIREALVSGAWAQFPGHPNYEMGRGDVDGWFATNYLKQWTIEQKWTLAAAIIGAMFYGAPAATNLPKNSGEIVDDEDGSRADEDDAALTPAV